MASTSFSKSNWQRTGGGVSQEERPAQPSDFPAYAKEWAQSQDVFNKTYLNWQAYADCFVMRRSVLTVSAKQLVHSNTFLANQIEDFTDTGYTSLPNYLVAGINGADTVPNGKWLNQSMSWEDQGNGNTMVSATYTQQRPWALVQVVSKLPNPRGDSVSLAAQARRLDKAKGADHAE